MVRQAGFDLLGLVPQDPINFRVGKFFPEFRKLLAQQFTGINRRGSDFDLFPGVFRNQLFVFQLVS